MDDAPEKVRRNLMIIATAIILLWFLRSPLQGRIFWVLDLSNVEPWRPWAAAFVFLIYCMLRFHTEPETEKARVKEFSNFLHIRKKVIGEYLFQHAQNVIKDNTASTKLAEIEPKTEDARLVTINTSQDEYGKSTPLYSRKAVLYWQQPREKGNRTFQQPTTFTLNIHDNIKVLATTLIEGKLFRWQLLEYGLPYGLALTAASMCIWSIYDAIRL